MTDLESEIEAAIDAVCLLGCEMVSGCISALQNGETRSQYQALDAAQRDTLLRELQAIMAVYEDR